LISKTKTGSSSKKTLLSSLQNSQIDLSQNKKKSKEKFEYIIK
jgi:hypothetical protein